jgi:type I restriction enzyme M protein
MFGDIPQQDVDIYQQFWDALPTLKDKLFRPSENGGYCACTESIKDVIESDESVKSFRNSFNSALTGFPEELQTTLVDKVENVALGVENSIVQNLFTRLSGVRLIDPYEAYQILAKHWMQISSDIETIQSESLKVLNQCTALTKNKNGKETVLGYEGRILPYSLVQWEIAELKAMLQQIQKKESEQQTLNDAVQEALDQLSQEDKESCAAFSDDENSTLNLKEAKALFKKEKDSYSAELIKAIQLAFDNEKKQKEIAQSIKTTQSALDKKTKEVIETLDSNLGKKLLYKKWILPLFDELNTLPDSVISAFTASLENLTQRYETTLPKLDAEIASTTTELRSLLGELTASDRDLAGLEKLIEMLGE